MKRQQKTVADRIKGRAKEERITGRDFAKFFGVNERTWSNWMRNPETQISIGRLRVIAAMLNTKPSVLLGEEEAQAN